MKRSIITSAVLLATAAAGTTVLVAAPANADVDRRGTCAGATFELSVDRERGGFEVDADINGARPGSEWRMTIRHDGKVAASRVMRADNEGELDVDTYRRNTAGTDTFKMIVAPVGVASCSAKVTLR